MAHMSFSISAEVVSCTVYEIAFDRSKIALFCYPLAFNAPDGGVPLVLEISDRI